MLAFVLAHLVDSDNVRMLQAGHGLRLGLKTLYGIHRLKTFQQKHFHGDDAVQACLARAIDNAHPSARNFFQQLIVTEKRSFGFWILDFGSSIGGLPSAPGSRLGVNYGPMATRHRGAKSLAARWREKPVLRTQDRSVRVPLGMAVRMAKPIMRPLWPFG